MTLPFFSFSTVFSKDDPPDATIIIAGVTVGVILLGTAVGLGFCIRCCIKNGHSYTPGNTRNPQPAAPANQYYAHQPMIGNHPPTYADVVLFQPMTVEYPCGHAMPALDKY